MSPKAASAGCPSNEAKVRANLKRMAEAPQSHLCALVARKANGKLVGYMAGQIEEYFFCRKRVASSMFLFVDPKRNAEGSRR